MKTNCTNRKWNKVVMLTASLMAGVLLFTGCGAPSGGKAADESSKKNEKPVLNVYNWGDYIDEDLLAQFKEETGITINYETFPSNEDMYAKLKNGGAGYDLAIPSDYMIEKMIREGLVEKIDFNNVPNIKNIDQRFNKLDYDPTGEYSVPYMWGTLGILYNKTMVEEPVTSWDILWDEKYKDEIYMYDSQRDSIGVTLKRLGYSLNTRDVDELNEAGEALKAQKSLVQAYVGDNIKDKMINEEGALAVVYSGDAMLCMAENENLDYAVPIEGSNKWYDSIVIISGAKHKKEAEAFINFLCDAEVGLKNTEYIGFSTVNRATYELLPAEKKNDPVYWPPIDVYNSCEVFLDLDTFITEYDRVWTEVLANN